MSENGNTSSLFGNLILTYNHLTFCSTGEENYTVFLVSRCGSICNGYTNCDTLQDVGVLPVPGVPSSRPGNASSRPQPIVLGTPQCGLGSIRHLIPCFLQSRIRRKQPIVYKIVYTFYRQTRGHGRLYKRASPLSHTVLHRRAIHIFNTNAYSF